MKETIIELEENFSTFAKQLYKNGLNEQDLINLLKLALDEIPEKKD